MGKQVNRLRSCAVASAVAVIAGLATAQAATASGGSLTITTEGLPGGARPSLRIVGPGFHRTTGRRTVALKNLSPGRYTVRVNVVRIRRGTDQILAGAKAYPARKRVLVRVRAGRSKRLKVGYAAVLNPHVTLAPKEIVGIQGDTISPTAIVLSRGAATPAVGTILTSVPTPAAPSGLGVRVTAATTTTDGDLLIVPVQTVPITDIAPQLSFGRKLKLRLAEGKKSPRLNSVSAKCAPPGLIDFRARLDEVSLRQASIGAIPPQVRLTLAVRTTESLGISAASAGIDCSFSLGEIGPFEGAIPVGPIVIPVYATIPVTAKIKVEGTLEVGKFNVASTTVANVALGAQNNVDLSQQGTNAWVDGNPSLQGAANLSADVSVQAGIGVANGANVHVAAGFGPEFSWKTGEGCHLGINLHALSAGVTVFGHSFNTDPLIEKTVHVWDGCTAASPPPPNDDIDDGPTPTTSSDGRTPGGSGARVTLAQGPAFAQGNYRYDVTLDGYPANSAVSITCYDSVSPGGFFTFALGTDGAGHAQSAAYCHSPDGPDHWVIAGGVSSNHVTWGGAATPPPTRTWSEQESPNHPVNTFANYHDASGQGPPIGAGQTVEVSCKVQDGTIDSTRPDGYWYRIASSPWNNAYYAPANTFMNGDPPGGPYTHNTDFAVQDC
jgi:hypothetical protein